MATTSYIGQIHIADSINDISSRLGNNGDICFLMVPSTKKIRGIYVKAEGSWREGYVVEGLSSWSGIGMNISYLEQIEKVQEDVNKCTGDIVDCNQEITAHSSAINTNAQNISELTQRVINLGNSISNSQGVGKSTEGDIVSYPNKLDGTTKENITCGVGAEVFNIPVGTTNVNNKAVGTYSHAEGRDNVSEGTNSHSEGSSNYSVGNSSHTEGSENTASGAYSHVEGYSNTTRGDHSHIEGNRNSIGTDGTNSHAEGSLQTITSANSHGEGNNNTISGNNGHAEGSSNTVSELSSHAEGSSNTSSGQYSHTEGLGNVASASTAHAEGRETDATANYAHSEGFSTTASGISSHAEGDHTISSGRGSHAEGYYAESEADYSHASGYYVKTKDPYSTMVGRYNDLTLSKAILFGVGNGSDDSHRKTGLYFTTDGKLYIENDLIVNNVSFSSLQTTDFFFGTQSEYDEAISDGDIDSTAVPIIYETTVTENSNKLITSGAVYTAIDTVENEIPTTYIVSIVKNLVNNTYVATSSTGETVVIQGSNGETTITGGYVKSIDLDSSSTNFIYTFTKDDNTTTTITIDKTATENSNNLITSGAVYDALSNISGDGDPVFFGTEQAYIDAVNNNEIRPGTVIIKYDNYVSSSSNNLITSAAVFDAISDSIPNIVNTYSNTEITNNINEIWS